MGEPKFIPLPGQIDYTNARYAPVVNSIVTHQGKILLVKRSPDMRLYPNCWNGISGFLDDNRSIEEKVQEELEQELGLSTADIIKIERGHPLLQEAPEYKKTWLVIPCFVEVRTDQFKLNWEAQEAHWFDKVAAKRLDLLPGFEQVLDQFLQR